MGWSAALPISPLRGNRSQPHGAHCQTESVAVATLGVDIGKNTFHLVGLDKRGTIVLRERLSRARTRFAWPTWCPAWSTWRPASVQMIWSIHDNEPGSCSGASHLVDT